MSDLMLQTWVRLQTLVAAAKHAARDEEGQGLVEYALILVLVSVVCIALLTTVGSQANNVFSKISSSLTGAGS